MPVEILPLKLVVTPLLIAAATLVARRWGHGVGGWLAGFPLTSAPVSVFLAIEQGPDFAAGAATGTLLGLTALAVFALVCVSLALVAALLPTTRAAVSSVKPPAWDLPLRMAVATTLVLFLTA